MAISFSPDNLEWWQSPRPTPDELHLSGGLHVEDWPHARQVVRLCLLMFEATRPLHQLDASAARLLDRAAFLHNAGMLIEHRRHHKHSYRLIVESRLPDFTDEERQEIACIARYHRRALPSIEHEEYVALSRASRKRVSILSALLRVADALDYSHDGRVLNLEAIPELCNNRIWTMRLEARPLAELETELERAYEKADLFEKVFKRKLQFVTLEEEQVP